MPATPPVRNATCSASRNEPVFAAAAVRTLPRVARLMPMKPVRPGHEAAGDERERAVEAALGLGQCLRRRGAASPGLMTLVDVRNTMTATGTRMTRIVRNWRFR